MTNSLRSAVVVPHDSEGNVIAGNFAAGIIGAADTIENARAFAAAQGYRLTPFKTPDTLPGSLIGQGRDAFAVGVES